MNEQAPLLKTLSIQNNIGTKVVITNLGCRIMQLLYNGIDIVQGFDSAEEYFPERHLSDFGAIIGRYANRLANGKITIDGKVYSLPQNNGSNCLHGGHRGWQYSLFEIVSIASNQVKFALTSPDGDNGFPGTVNARITYTISDDNSLRIDYYAESDSTTVLNLTNHSYFNLNGDLSSSIENHILQIDADRFTPTDNTAIPLGEHLPVDNSPFDFRSPKAIGNGINDDHPQIVIGNGYDHNFVLNKPNIDNISASLYSPSSGIRMDVMTNAPGVQLYTGNFLDGVIGKQNQPYPRRSAVCLETQQYPDSPNNNWPESTGYLYKDKPFRCTTIFKLYHD